MPQCIAQTNEGQHEENHHPHEFHLCCPNNFSAFSTVYRLQFLGEGQNNVLVDGYLMREYNGDNSTTYCYVNNRDGETVESFYFRPKLGSIFLWDLTDKYKDAYPQVTKVELCLMAVLLL